MSLNSKPDAGARQAAAFVLVLTAGFALIPTFAFAYVGPGLGMGAIASVFSLIGAVFLGILGFLWYPFKRLIRLFRKPKTTEE